MGLLDIFKKDKKFNLPGNYKGIINKDDYNLVINITKKYLSEKEIEITRIEDGDIVTEIEGEEQHRYLDNLVRLLSSNEKELWEKLIYEHFDKLKENKSAYNYLFKDFEYASQFLRVLIKGEDSDFAGSITDFIYRKDFPKTNTFLVLEFEEQFKYLEQENIAEWDQTAEDLFQIAISNIPDEEVEAKEYQYCGKFKVYIFFSGDYSSALMLDLKNRADFSIGTYGSLIAIPTKGTAFTHPIETGDILELVETLNPSVEEFYNSDLGNITTNFYWYYDGNIQIFPIGQDDNGYFIRLPEDLLKLLKNEK